MANFLISLTAGLVATALGLIPFAAAIYAAIWTERRTGSQIRIGLTALAVFAVSGFYSVFILQNADKVGRSIVSGYHAERYD